MKKENKKALKFIVIVLSVSFFISLVPVLIIFLGIGWEALMNSFYNSSTKREMLKEIQYDGLDMCAKIDSLKLKSFDTVVYEGELCREYKFEILGKVDSFLFLDSFLEMEDVGAVQDEESHPLSVLFGNGKTAFSSELNNKKNSFQWACYSDCRQLTKAEEYENVDVSMIAIYDRDDSLLYIYRYNI